MEALSAAIRTMITVSDHELEKFLQSCYTKKFEPKEFLSKQGELSNEIFLYNQRPYPQHHLHLGTVIHHL